MDSNSGSEGQYSRDIGRDLPLKTAVLHKCRCSTRMMRVRANAANLPIRTTQMTASPISGDDGGQGLIESAQEPLNGPISWSLFGTIEVA